MPKLLNKLVLVAILICHPFHCSHAANIPAALKRSSIAHAGSLFSAPDAERFAPGGSIGNSTNGSLLPDRKQNLWILVCCCLLGFISLPGLLLFHSGPWRAGRFRMPAGHYVAVAATVAALWWLFGYSAIFADGGGQVFGDCSKFAFLKNVGWAVNLEYSFQGSQIFFCLYHLLIALLSVTILTAPLAGHLRLPVLLFCVGTWMILVYFPLARMLWGVDGVMNGLWNPSAKIRAIDFAGALVVQIAAGWSGLVYFLILVERELPARVQPLPINRSRLIAFLAGEAMVWIGWHGLSGGVWAELSLVPQAFLAMMLATLVAAFAWTVMEATMRRKPSLPGACTGALAGLMAIMPAAAFITANGAVIIGLSVGLFPLLNRLVRPSSWPFEIFGVHVLCGILGVLLGGILASDYGSRISLPHEVQLNGLAVFHDGELWLEQLKALLITLAIAGSASGLVGLFIKAAAFGISQERLRGSDMHEPVPHPDH